MDSLTHLQQQQLGGPLRGGADELQGPDAARTRPAAQRGLQQTHHRRVVAGLVQPLDLLQRLAALQALQLLINLAHTTREGE